MRGCVQLAIANMKSVKKCSCSIKFPQDDTPKRPQAKPRSRFTLEAKTMLDELEVSRESLVPEKVGLDQKMPKHRSHSLSSFKSVSDRADWSTICMHFQKS